jgi:hypothetical protein
MLNPLRVLICFPVLIVLAAVIMPIVFLGLLTGFLKVKRSDTFAGCVHR